MIKVIHMVVKVIHESATKGKGQMKFFYFDISKFIYTIYCAVVLFTRNRRQK